MEVAKNKDIMKLFLPPLRADYIMLKDFRYFLGYNSSQCLIWFVLLLYVPVNSYVHISCQFT